MTDWRVFTGSGDSDGAERLSRLPGPPPWRDFTEWPAQRGRVLHIGSAEIDMVNAALYLRRPLLVTGPPGCGKSSLAHAIAHELCLGPVLWWPVNSRTTVKDGLYRYDAVARLRDANLATKFGGDEPGLGEYLRLGPLGTALVAERPRVLLVDEIDKGDVDLPNDLLHVFEEGSFEIPELTRLARKQHDVVIETEEREETTVVRGKVGAVTFPVVILTSNGEREFPPAFVRRCLRLDLTPPDDETLVRIVKAHVDAVDDDVVRALVAKFVGERDEPGHLLATDQLLNAVFLVARGRLPDGPERDRVIAELFRDLRD